MHTCTCIVLTTPVKNACILSAKNAYALVHARICNGAEDSLPRPWKLLRTYPESCTSIVQAVVCRLLLLPILLSRPNLSPDAVRSRNLSKSTLAHDVVAAAVLHKHHAIIRVGAGLIQFVYWSHSHLSADLISIKFLFLQWFFGLFLSQSSRVQDGGKSRHDERGASNVHSAGSSRSLASTFTRCDWVEVVSA